MKVKSPKSVQIKGTVSEMARKLDALKIEVPFAPDVDIDSLTKGDKNPMFVTIEAVNDTVSKGKRRYTPQVIEELARQINDIKPDGYDGHLKDEDRPYARPKSQTIWLGAAVKNVEGKLRLFVKGYVFPYAKELRQYLKAAKATGKKVAVSIYGQAEHVWNEAIKAYDLRNFNLESIDWARSGAEGVPALGYLSVASEMKGKRLDRAEIIKSASLSEVKQYNPELIKEMTMEIKVQVVKEMKDNQATTISEMETQIKQLKAEKVDNYVDGVLKSKVVSETARKVIKSLIVREIGDETELTKVGETVGAILRSEEAQAIVREMTAKPIVFNPLIDNRSKTGESRKFTVIK